VPHNGSACTTRSVDGFFVLLFLGYPWHWHGRRQFLWLKGRETIGTPSSRDNKSIVVLMYGLKGNLWAPFDGMLRRSDGIAIAERKLQCGIHSRNVVFGFEHFSPSPVDESEMCCFMECLF
jgi:hypothetical protein